MKEIWYAFKQYVKEIWNDIILAGVIFAPILMGAAFKFLIPLLEVELCELFGKNEILQPYYLSFDLVLVAATPVMFVFSGVMVILEEIDNGIARYLIVTPLGKNGYIISRIGITSVISFVYVAALALIFHISDISNIQIFICAILSSVLGIMISFLIITLSHNKVEGMALSKLSGLLIVGMIIPFFVQSPIKYLVAFLPTFWMAEYCFTNNILLAALSLVIASAFIFIFNRRFIKKIA